MKVSVVNQLLLCCPERLEEGSGQNPPTLAPKVRGWIPSLLLHSLWDGIGYPKHIHPNLSELAWVVQGCGFAFPVMNWWMWMISFLGGKELSSTGTAQNPSCDWSDLHFIREDQKEMTVWAHSYSHQYRKWGSLRRGRMTRFTGWQGFTSVASCFRYFAFNINNTDVNSLSLPSA